MYNKNKFLVKVEKWQTLIVFKNLLLFKLNKFQYLQPDVKRLQSIKKNNKLFLKIKNSVGAEEYLSPKTAVRKPAQKTAPTKFTNLPVLNVRLFII